MWKIIYNIILVKLFLKGGTGTYRLKKYFRTLRNISPGSIYVTQKYKTWNFTDIKKLL